MVRRRAVLWALLAVGTLAAAACTSSEPSSGPPVPPEGWTRVSLGHPFDEKEGHVDSVDRITVNKTGLWLGLGTVSDRPGALQKPAAWASSDDKNWRSIGVPVEADEVGAATTATSFESLGLMGGEIGAGDDAVPVVWTSSTGWEWRPAVRLPLPSDRRGVTVADIAHGPGGWVAVGGPVPGGSSPPLFWYSSDGERWALGDGGSLRASSGATATSVAATGDRYVATVAPSDPEQARRGGSTVVSSADGRTWQPVVLTGFDPPVAAGSVLRIRDWFVVAVGCCDGTSPRLAVSRDGQSWAPGLSLAGLSTTGDGSPPIELHDRAGRLVASVAAGQRLSLWQTAADQDLGDQSAPASQSFTALADPPAPADPAGGDRVATAGPTIVVVRPGGRDVAVSWTATDDGTWGRAFTEIPPPVRRWSEAVDAVATAGGTVVAVGHATYRDPAHDEGRAWYSTGTLLGWEEVIVNGNINDVVGVATDGVRFVAVGVKGDGGTVLRSVDGRAWEEIDKVPPADPSAPSSSSSTTATTSAVLGSGTDRGSVFDGERPVSIVHLDDHYLVATDAGRLWSSTDGSAWTAVDVSGDQASGGAVRGPLCAAEGFGVDVPWRSSDGARWTNDPALAEVMGSTCAVAASGAVLTMGSADDAVSHGWLAAPDGGAAASVDVTGLGLIDGVATRGTGWMVLGSTVGGDPDGDPGVWTSPVGTGDWQPIAAAMRLVAERGPGRLSATVVANNRLVLAGTSNDAATVLLGPP